MSEDERRTARAEGNHEARAAAAVAAALVIGTYAALGTDDDGAPFLRLAFAAVYGLGVPVLLAVQCARVLPTPLRERWGRPGLGAWTGTALLALAPFYQGPSARLVSLLMLALGVLALAGVLFPAERRRARRAHGPRA